MSRLTIDNHAPDADAIAIRDEREEDFTITIYRDENEKVHVIVQEHGWRGGPDLVRSLVLGRKTINRLPNMNSVKNMKPRKIRREPVGE